MGAPARSTRKIGRDEVEHFVGTLFDEDMHAKRVASLTDGVDGVLHAASLGIRAIGQGLAAAQGLAPRHAIKQVDRLLSNSKLDMERVFHSWVRFAVAERKEIFVNFDWTEFEASDQATIVLGMQTRHGRSTPLVWQTVTRSALGHQRNEHEDELLMRFAAVVPEGVRVTVVADRGFGDAKLYGFLDALGFDYVIRFRSVITVESAKGEYKKAREWVGPGGRMRLMRACRVTANRVAVPTVVCVQERGMKEAWCLASSRCDLSGTEIKQVYNRRFSIEETFRDAKNARLGLGLKQAVVARNDRRDALFLLAVLSHALLTLLGQASRELGLERWLGASREGGLSLFRQGLLLYELLPTMDETRLRALLERFGEILRRHALYTDILGLL